jgi:uncharacterized membrane protein (UPF0127 family)
LAFAPAWLVGCKPNGSSATPATTNAPAPTPAAPTAPGGPGEVSETRLPTVRMQIGSETFTLEVAYSDEEQQQGLMNRRRLAPNFGMIFVNNDEAERQFWMKNTLIPLDILYLDRTGRVVSIKHMKPLDLTGVPSNGPAMYAIELNVGTAARVGVKPGDTLKLPDDVRVP